MKPYYRKLIICLVLLLSHVGSSAYARQAGTNPPMPGFDVAGSDARAIDIADAVMESLGGRENWDKTRYLTWSFGSSDQVWDKWTGAFRYQREGLIVLMNVVSMEGRAWEDGRETTDASELEKTLSRAYRAWVNSGYWFLMPYKLKDSGVTLKYKGEARMENGREAYVLNLTFKDIGLTPNNMYDVFVDKETMLVGQWSHYGSRDDPKPRFTNAWGNWKRYGKIMLSDRRGADDDPDATILPNVGAYDELPESVFKDPAPIDLTEL